MVLFVSTATNYRFGLLAFSRMFPRPCIPIKMACRLTPLNYLAMGSLLLDVLGLTAAVMLIYKEDAGTNLFMLGVDLLIVLVVVMLVSIWMVAVPKPE